MIQFPLLFYSVHCTKTIEQKYTFIACLLLRFHYMCEVLLREKKPRAILNMNNHSVNVGCTGDGAF